MFTFQELRKLKNDIAAAAGISTAAAARVIGYYNGGGPSLRPDIVAAMIAGDFSHVGPALSALGIPAADDLQKGSAGTDNGSRESKTGSASAGPDDLQADNIKAGSDMVPDGVGDDLHAAPDGFQNAPQKTKRTQADKRTTKQKKTNTSPQAVKGPDVVKGVHDDLEHVKSGPVLECVQGDILTDGDGLPASIRYDIENTMQDFAQHYNIDLEKCSGLQWRAVCLNIGDMLQASGVLIDRQKQRMQGGKPYKPERVAALVGIWERFTTLYKHMPIRSDFIAFSGVSRDWFYDSHGKGLTSTQADIIKRVREIEESAMAAALVDPRENPTGRIFYSKCKLDYRENNMTDSGPAFMVVSLSQLKHIGINGG